IPDVQKRYRTIETRYGRGVAGLSMGGYGALKFGLKSPATFAFAASMSGVLDIASWTEDELKNLTWIRKSVDSVFGPQGSPTRKANDIFEIIRAMPAARITGLPYFYFDCGNEDTLCGSSGGFAALLREKKVPHEYRQLPGSHGWPYWDQQVQEVVKIAARQMHAAPVK
ncbi:MAG TPA: alpha/beta hydrolase-fold protein, partial [Pyrinomonadaceae bacterium]